MTASRAEYSRYRSVLRAVRASPSLELQLLVTGAHMLERFGESYRDIEADGFAIDGAVYQTIEGGNLVSMAKSTGYTIAELASAVERLAPDIALVMGDRFEALAFAATAALMNVRVAHIQGGEVSGTIDESLRHAITKLSHLHFPATPASAERIIRLGEDRARVHVVGCPATDNLMAIELGDRPAAMRAIEPFFKIRARPKTDEPFLLVVQHPVTTEYELNREHMRQTMQAVHDLRMQAIMLWPNLDAGSDDVSMAIRHFLIANPIDNLFLFKHLPVDVFMKLLAHADCLVGNSSAGVREACYFGTPVVNVGSRQHGRERGQNVLDAPPEADAIRSAAARQIEHGRYPPEQVYGDGRAGAKIATILASVDLGPVQKTIAY